MCLLSISLFVVVIKISYFVLDTILKSSVTHMLGYLLLSIYLFISTNLITRKITIVSVISIIIFLHTYLYLDMIVIALLLSRVLYRLLILAFCYVIYLCCWYLLWLYIVINMWIVKNFRVLNVNKVLISTHEGKFRLVGTLMTLNIVWMAHFL